MDVRDTETTNRFFQAIQGGEVAAVDSLLVSWPDLIEVRSSGGLRPLTAAVYSGATMVAQLLVERGVAVDIFDATALGDADRVRDLLDRQPALAHAYSDDGWTALHLAGHFGQTECAAVLLDQGADLGALSRNRNGNTALHAALAGRQGETTRLLVERGADVTAADAAGYTPLHLAAHEGNVALVELLLAAGADPRAAKADGQTALDLAQTEGHTEVANLLRRNLT